MGDEKSLRKSHFVSIVILCTHDFSLKNCIDFNRMITFNPFSRYIPLRIEARLDDYLMKVVEEYARRGFVSDAASDFGVMQLEDNGGMQLEADSEATFNSLSFSDSTPSYSLQALPAVDQEAVSIWQAVNAGVPWVEALGVKIHNPTIALNESSVPSRNPIAAQVHSVVAPVTLLNTSNVAVSVESTSPLPAVTTLESLPPSSGFVLSGDIPLFGRDDLIAQLEIWQGPAPAGVVVRPGLPVAVSRATITSDVCLSSLISELKDTPFDKIRFRNVSVYYQNYSFDPTKALGWHLSADWVIDESCGPLHEVLRQVLNVQEPLLTISAGLGTKGGWGRPLEVQSFSIEGVFKDISLKPIDGLTLTSIGVRLLGIRALKYSPEPHTTLEYGFAVFGAMNISVPGTAVPLQLGYEIREFAGALQLAADIPIWQNPLGAQGLTVSHFVNIVVGQIG